MMDGDSAPRRTRSGLDSRPQVDERLFRRVPGSGFPFLSPSEPEPQFAVILLGRNRAAHPFAAGFRQPVGVPPEGRRDVRGAGHQLRDSRLRKLPVRLEQRKGRVFYRLRIVLEVVYERGTAVQEVRHPLVLLPDRNPDVNVIHPDRADDTLLGLRPDHRLRRRGPEPECRILEALHLPEPGQNAL